jgi:hypothetical protein
MRILARYFFPIPGYTENLLLSSDLLNPPQFLYEFKNAVFSENYFTLKTMPEFLGGCDFGQTFLDPKPAPSEIYTIPGNSFFEDLAKRARTWWGPEEVSCGN